MTPPDHTDDHIRKIVREEMTTMRSEQRAVIREAVREALIILGIDASNPLELQQDMAHLRRQRMGGDALKSKMVWAVLASLFTGLVGLVVIGVRQWLTTPPR